MVAPFPPGRAGSGRAVRTKNGGQSSCRIGPRAVGCTLSAVSFRSQRHARPADGLHRPSVTDLVEPPRVVARGFLFGTSACAVSNGGRGYHYFGQEGTTCDSGMTPSSSPQTPSAQG